MLTSWLRYLAISAVLALSACGGGGGGEADTNQSMAMGARVQPALVTVDLQSDPGDYIGNGLNYRYTKADSAISVSYAGGLISVGIAGDQNWTGDFKLPGTPDRLKNGTYTGLTRYPFAPADQGAMNWSGEGRGCNMLTGSFTVEKVVYSKRGVLESFNLSFEQHCEGATAALRGQIQWTIHDTTVPPGPVSPPPPDLWSPAPGSVPASGRYVYLQSDAGDYIGRGQTYLYTASNANLAASINGGLFSVSVTGDQSWSGQFQAMSSVAQLQPGYYPDLKRYPFHNAVKGGLNWSGDGRGCNTLKGWFVVDEVSYANGALASIKLRFEQHCEGVTAALRGQINWVANDTTQPPGPVNPPPAGLWAPAQGSTPTSGRYVYLQSDAGDYIGQGQTHLYTSSNASLTASNDGGLFSVNVNGDQNWSGQFKAMSELTQLQPGYYGDLQRYPFHNPAKGGLSWSGEGRGCNTLKGWFVVDEVSYDNGALASIKLRFEQHCEGVTAALRGQVNWVANEVTPAPPGPVNPPPADLWAPASGATPATGRYVYLQSDAGDYIGQGQTYLYTDSNATLSASSNGNLFHVGVSGPAWWGGDFKAMSDLTQLQPGYYGDLQRYPFHNPAKGGLSWSGQGRGCNTLTGWFVVDSVTYVGGSVASIKLRFEQHCEGGVPALRGEINWTP